MSLNPYIAFAGNCAEAIAFYQQTLNAELMFKMTFGEMPPPAQDAADGCPSGQKMAADAIAHASLRIAGSEIMVSDSVFGDSVQYAGFTLVLNPADVTEGQRWFEGLAVGGRIEMAWQETFWAHGFGKVVDRFGVPWMINVVKAS
ncbi:VOC family metalloprotein YjdN [Klebsiella aerogenes]|nr:VOC family metalloprotein YjdN [Klebsiella aerogenes]